VYYTAVRAFGGDGETAGKRAEDVLVKEYEAAVANYNKLVAEAQANGQLWEVQRV